jgi:hypothetical protein
MAAPIKIGFAGESWLAAWPDELFLRVMICWF